MKYESEMCYVYPAGFVDSEPGMRGVADDGMGDATAAMTTPSGASTTWADAFKSALPVLASAYQQRQLTKLNVARINRNQPPLTAEEYAPMAAQVRVGTTDDTKKLLMYAAVGIAALVGLRAAKVI